MMYISLDWLKEFIDLPKNLDPKDLAEELTIKTAEVDNVKTEGEGLESVVVGELIKIDKHPNADKLNIAKVDIGKKEPIQLIFGQMVKMKVGNKVPVAIAPTTLPTGMKINKANLRGVTSEGMLCLDQELGFKKEGADIQYFPNTKPGTPLAEALKLSDTIFEFDNKSLTHRPDLWGHYGIAREVAAITGAKLKPLVQNPKIPEKGESIKVEVKFPKLCPRFCALVITGIKVEDSPEWLKNRLISTGHGTHNNIVDVTNYVMAEIGQPMHAFDKNLIKGGLIIRMANPGEPLLTLDGKDRKLTEEMGVVADQEGATGVAGIIGGHKSEIKNTTTTIILEAANWHPTILRRASIELGVRTDAVQRFEKGLDPALTEIAIKRAAEIILKICPDAKIAGPMTDIRNYEEKEIIVDFNIENARTKIGVNLSADEMKKHLEKLEFKVIKKDKKTFKVIVPGFRATKDINIEDDLIEEVARMYGYENIPETLPTLPAKLPIENTVRFKKHRAREILSYGLGFSEVYNYSFYSKTDFEKCLMQEEGHIKLLNHLSEDQTHLRMSLVPNILKNLTENIKYFNEVKIYEIGRTYKEIGQYFPLEEKKICGAILKKGTSDEIFYEAKGAIETLFKKFNIPKLHTAKEVKKPYAHPGKALSYLENNGKTLGEVYMLHPNVMNNFEFKKCNVAIFTVNFSELMNLEAEPKKYQQIPRFPSIIIDVSVVVDKNIEIKTLETAIYEADKNLIVSVELFDLYEGENIEKGKKAVAFQITLQTLDRTLTDEDMAGVQKKIFLNLEKRGGIIRGK